EAGPHASQSSAPLSREHAREPRGPLPPPRADRSPDRARAEGALSRQRARVLLVAPQSAPDARGLYGRLPGALSEPGALEADVRDILATVLSLWFFATPVLYSLRDVSSPRLLRALSWNPLAPLFAGWHDALFYGRWIDSRTWGLAALVSLAAFALGYALFDRL